jgi:FkbM family methyltransferase
MRKYDEDFVFVDIGANYGLYSIVAMKNTSCLQAHSIEPNPAFLDYLKMNGEKNNSRLVIHDVGIGEKNEQRELSYKEFNSGRGSLVQKFEKSAQIIMRDHTLLDDIGKMHPQGRFFLKIDVEGYESIVVEEFIKSEISSRTDFVFIEISPMWIKPKNVKRVFDQLDKLGFIELWRSGGSNQSGPIK